MGLEAAQFPSGLGAVPLKSLITTGSQHPLHVRYILYTGHSIGVGWWGVGGGGVSVIMSVSGGVSVSVGGDVSGDVSVSVGGRVGERGYMHVMPVTICILFTVINHLTAIKFIVYTSKWQV